MINDYVHNAGAGYLKEFDVLNNHTVLLALIEWYVEYNGRISLHDGEGESEIRIDGYSELII
jgi:hypothetical protein